MARTRAAVTMPPLPPTSISEASGDFILLNYDRKPLYSNNTGLVKYQTYRTSIMTNW